MSLKTYTHSELETLLNGVESDLVERKESWKGDSPETGRQAVCAFANDIPDRHRPGVLFVGAKDNGQPSHIPITDELLRTLSDIKTDGQILPPPSMVVQREFLNGADMAVVIIQPADAPPVRYKGRIYIRIGPRRGTASAQDERILNEKRRCRDLPFDIQPVHSASMSDLSRILFEQEYLPNAFAPDVLDANERRYEERLAACKMITTADDPTPTVLGLLVIGKSPRDWFPGAYIQFLRIKGSQFSDPILDEASIDGSLAQMLRRLDEKLDVHNQIAVDFTSTSIESRSTVYPRVALQQFTRNAVMHRTLEGTNAPIRIYWFNDRIEILNPGGPYGIVTCENFGKPGITDYRNVHLAEAMKVLGYVQKFGVGIANAQAELLRNGNPPAELQPSISDVLVTIRRKP
jgi:ATP-dependent DNA helicase RecG